jgi:hypothetical protein
MAATSVPALLRQQVDRWVETSTFATALEAESLKMILSSGTRA